LRDERGLTDETIRRYELGYDRDEDAIVIPVRDNAGCAVAIKRRFLAPDAKPKTANSVGPLRLYPALPAKGWLLFVPGELDALSGRQLGMPAITSTGGWLSKEQVPLLSRRQIVLLPDVGEERAAELQAEALRKEGCEVLIVHWPAGCPDKFDLNDWVAKRGGTRDALLGLIWQAARDRSAAQ
jgi:DNA primase